MTRVARLAARIVAAIAVLALVVSWVGARRVTQALQGADLGWAAIALTLSIASNAASAWRWTRIAHALGLRASPRSLVPTYFRAITINLFVPGATLGGDAYRAMVVHRSGNPLAESALSVFIDRFSGLWTLAWLSLGASIVAWSQAAHNSAAPVDARLAWLYIAAMAGIVVAPVVVAAVPLTPSTAPATTARTTRSARVRDALARLHHLVVDRRWAIARSTGPSVIVQTLSAAALWACVRALGSDTPYPGVLAMAAPVFIAGALPVSIAGFGAREFAALAFLPLLGMAPSTAVSAALMYGVGSVVQGLLAAPSFIVTRATRTLA